MRLWKWLILSRANIKLIPSALSLNCNTLLAHILKQYNGSGILFLVATQGAIHGYQETQAIELTPSPPKKKKLTP
jgi:hypothetical protein